MVSCYYNNEEELFPELFMDCDTLNISYTQTIRPILQNSCYVCHSNSNAGSFGGDIHLEDYSDLINVVESGQLLGAVSHDDGYSPMPKEGPQLNECAILQIKTWIENGSPNN